MNLDINSLYFSLLIPFVLEKNELAEELDIKEDVFINTEDVWSLFTSKVEDIDIHLKEKIDIIIQKYNSDVKSSFLESAESILKNTIAKNIFIIKRIKDKLRKAVVRAQNKEKTIHLITNVMSHSHDNINSKPTVVFDYSIDYTIKTPLGISYRVEDDINKEILITKEQQILINHVILNGDFKPKGFKKCENIWKYWDVSMISDSFGLETINCPNSIKFTQSTEKEQKELMNNYNLEYCYSILKSAEQSNKYYSDKMDYERIQSRSIIINPYSIQNFNWLETIDVDDSIRFHYKKSKSIKRVWWDKFNTLSSEEFSEVFQISAERNFGSFTKMFNKKSQNESDKEDIIKSLKQRWWRIKQLVSNGIIDKKLSRSYLENQIKFLIDYYWRNPINQYHDNVIGWQTFPIYPENKVIEYPFEALYRVSGAYPRLAAIERYEVLSSHPDFIKIWGLDEVLWWYSKWVKQDKGKNLID